MGDMVDSLLDSFALSGEEFDDQDFGFCVPPIFRTLTCNTCGKRKLVWEKEGGCWRLYDPVSKDWHVCKPGDEFSRLLALRGDV
jgi:hypothetical protein